MKRIFKFATIALVSAIFLPSFATSWRLKFRDATGQNSDRLIHLPSSSIMTFNADSAKFVVKYNGASVDVDYLSMPRAVLELKEEFEDKIEITSAPLIMGVGQIDTIKAIHLSENLDTLPSKIAWLSSNPNVLTVDSLGIIRALRNGIAKITATAECDSWAENSIEVQTSVLTSLGEIRGEAKTVSLQGNLLIIKGVKPHSHVGVYSVAGMLLTHGKCNELGEAEISLAPCIGPLIIKTSEGEVKLHNLP